MKIKQREKEKEPVISLRRLKERETELRKKSVTDVRDVVRAKSSGNDLDAKAFRYNF